MDQLLVEQTTADILHDIVCQISTNSTQITNSSLPGKMGAAIFLFHYARYYKIQDCKHLADGFIEQVRNNLAALNSTDQNSDIPGIGAGFTYLLKNGFIDKNTAEMPESAQQIIYKSLPALPHENIPQYLHRLSVLGKYFTQAHRIRSLTASGPFSDINRNCVMRLISILYERNIKITPQVNYKDILSMTGVLSRIYPTGFSNKEIRVISRHCLPALEVVLFDKAKFKPFTKGCNPFNLALTLLSIYYGTYNSDFAALAIRLIEEYEGALNNIYSGEDICNTELLQHVIACKKLYAELKDETFNKYAKDGLDYYRKRINRDNNSVKYRDQNDFSLDSGYAGEGMALLTIEGPVGPDWLEDLTGYC